MRLTSYDDGWAADAPGVIVRDGVRYCEIPGCTEPTFANAGVCIDHTFGERRRPCARCGKEFDMQDSRWRFCSELCREIAYGRKKALGRSKPVSRSVPQREEMQHARPSKPSGGRRTRTKRPQTATAKICRVPETEDGRCYYCGELADGEDHVIPRMAAEILGDILEGHWIAKVTVPACTECNSTAGTKVFDTLGDRARYVGERLDAKYQRIAERPDWSDDELEELGYALQQSIRHGLNERDRARRRLRYSRSRFGRTYARNYDG